MKKLILLGSIIGCGIGMFGAEGQKPQNFVDEMEDDYRNKPEQEGGNVPPDGLTAKERLKWWDIEISKHKKGEEWWKTMRSLQIVKMLAQPKTAVGIGSIALLTFGAWHATKLAGDVAKHYLLIPPLCDPAESSIRGWGSGIKSIFVREDRVFPDRSQVVLSEHLHRRFEKLSRALTNAAKNDVFFRHYLFYGPPGTGKTMIAKAIAQEAGLEYMYFSAANLEQYSLEEGVQQIRHLFEYAKAYPKKLMIIMDEADSIFAHRDTCPDKTRIFLNKILTYTGTEQNKYIVIAITNRPKDFDEASLSRFGVKIKIDFPGENERRVLFGQYAEKYLRLAHQEKRDKRSVFQWMFSRKPAERTPLIAADDVFTDETFDELARKSEGLSGREIADIVSQVQHDAYGTEDHMIRKEMLFEALEEKLQDAEIMMDFKQNKASA